MSMHFLWSKYPCGGHVVISQLAFLRLPSNWSSCIVNSWQTGVHAFSCWTALLPKHLHLSDQSDQYLLANVFVCPGISFQAFQVESISERCQLSVYMCTFCFELSVCLLMHQQPVILGGIDIWAMPIICVHVHILLCPFHLLGHRLTGIPGGIHIWAMPISCVHVHILLSFPFAWA